MARDGGGGARRGQHMGEMRVRVANSDHRCGGGGCHTCQTSDISVITTDLLAFYPILGRRSKVLQLLMLILLLPLRQVQSRIPYWIFKQYRIESWKFFYSVL